MNGPDDSQKIQASTIAIATAVVDLVNPVKQVLALSHRVMRLVATAVLLMVLLLGAIGYVVWRQNQLIVTAQKTTDNEAATLAQLADVVSTLDVAATEVGKVKADVENIPRIDYVPAVVGDPTSKPAAVIRSKVPTSSGSKSAKHAPPDSIEIKLDLPTPKK